MSNITDYRIGNPILVKGKVTTIKDLPQKNDDAFGYKVTNSADGVQKDEITPIPIDEKILKHYGFTFDGIADFWSYKVGGHEVRIELYDNNNACCHISGNKKVKISYLHELFNLLYDECEGFTLRPFTGLP